MTTVIDRTAAVRDPAAGTATRERLPRAKPVTVNGIVIARGDIAQETQHHPAAKPVDAWLAAARALVVRELLLQEARRLALAPVPLADGEGRRETEEEALIRQLVAQEVVTPVADEATCRRIYDQQRERFRSSSLYAVRHILIPALPDDPVGRDGARGRAEAIIAEVQREPASFSDLASVHSACPSKQHGGALGQVSRGQTVPEFEAALEAAPVGVVMGQPVETRYGFHVVLVDQRVDGEQLPFEVARDGIRAWLADRSLQGAIHQYISLLAGRATITGVDMGAGSVPLES
jgi:peptidyl-prolyl cis-trans isomerase C